MDKLQNTDFTASSNFRSQSLSHDCYAISPVEDTDDDRLHKYVILELFDGRTLVVHRRWIVKNVQKVHYPKKHVPITDEIIRSSIPDGESWKLYKIKAIIASYRKIGQANKELIYLLNAENEPELVNSNFQKMDTNSLALSSHNQSSSLLTVDESQTLLDTTYNTSNHLVQISKLKNKVIKKDKMLNEYLMKIPSMQAKLDVMFNDYLIEIPTMHAKLDKLGSIEKILLELTNMTKKREETNVVDVNFDEILPKNSKKDLLELDKKLQEDKQFLEQFLLSLVPFEVQDYKMVTTILLEKILTKKLGSKISLTGKGRTQKGKPKLPFKSLYLHKIIQSIIIKKFPKIEYTNVNKTLRSWLDKAVRVNNKAMTN